VIHIVKEKPLKHYRGLLIGNIVSRTLAKKIIRSISWTADGKSQRDTEGIENFLNVPLWEEFE
jgi:hypothetical protein